MLWPVVISSTCPFNRPVHFHWAMKCGWERRAMVRVTTSDNGTTSSEISASSGEIQNIMASTPTTVSSDVTSCIITCWIVVEMLSMSLVTRLSRSPR